MVTATSAADAPTDEEADKDKEQLQQQAERTFLRRALLKEVEDFSCFTHIVGFERIFKAKFFVLRILWFLLVILALCLTFYQLVQLGIRYTANKDIIVDKKIAKKTSLTLPQVTLCDVNFLSFGKLKASDRFQRAQRRVGRPGEPFPNTNSFTEAEEWLALLLRQAEYYNQIIAQCIRKNPENELNRQNCVERIPCGLIFTRDQCSMQPYKTKGSEYISGHMAIDDRIRFLYQIYTSILSSKKIEAYVPSDFKNLIIDCELGGTNCWGPKYWRKFETPFAGTCFSLKDSRAKKTSCNNFKITGKDKSVTLRIVAGINQNDHFPMVNAESGVRVAFSSPCPTMPQLDYFSSAFNCKAGRQTQVRLKFTTKKLCRDEKPNVLAYKKKHCPEPHCITAKTLNKRLYKVFPLAAKHKFIMDNECCLQTNRWQAIKKNCGCLYYVSPLQHYMDESKFPICLKPKRLACAMEALKKDLHKENKKNCPPLWKSEEYPTDRSEMVYPGFNRADSPVGFFFSPNIFDGCPAFTILYLLNRLVPRYVYPYPNCNNATGKGCSLLQTLFGPGKKVKLDKAFKICGAMLEAILGQFYKHGLLTFDIVKTYSKIEIFEFDKDPQELQFIYWKSMFEIKISVSELEVIETKEDEGYSTMFFIAQMGGQAGLFCGACFLNFMEFVELLVNLCVVCHKVRTKKIRVLADLSESESESELDSFINDEDRQIGRYYHRGGRRPAGESADEESGYTASQATPRHQSGPQSMATQSMIRRSAPGKQARKTAATTNTKNVNRPGGVVSTKLRRKMR